MTKRLLLLSGVIILITAFVPKKKKEFLPPGTAKINDTLFADETEVSNFSWQEYETWMKVKYGANSPEHISALPDTLVWREKYSDNEPYVQYYYRHPAYKDYPVIGISYEQAVAFCKWRTERVKEFTSKSKKNKGFKCDYSLPTKHQWEFISNNGDGCFANSGKDEKGRMTSNHARAEDDTLGWNGTIMSNADVTAPVYAYWPNKFKLWNVIGNVAEMTSEKGICKGGGWRNSLEDCRVGKDLTYTKPTAWLGFRCVCVVKKKST